MLQRNRQLRKSATDAERCLWQRLRARQLAGCKFRRQESIGPYIVDFLCVDAKLIIEVDGGQHARQIEYDRRRTACLRARGFHVLRFWNHEVLKQTDEVLEEILRHLARCT